MIVLGIGGKYCSGKSTLAQRLADLGAKNVEADRLGHVVTELKAAEIAARFGSSILLADGKVDRRALASVVFNDSAALADLEAIIHPAVIQKIRDIIRENAEAPPPLPGPLSPAGPLADVLIVNAALLFRSGLDRVCDLVVWVSTPAIVRVWRGMRRDKKSFLAVLRLMKSQVRFGPQHYQPIADIHRVSGCAGQRNVTRVIRILER